MDDLVATNASKAAYFTAQNATNSLFFTTADGSLGVQRRDILKEYGSENTEEVVTKALEDNLVPLEKSVI